METLRKEKGITLVALVITIIILLILAVVTISNLEEESIISEATEAQKEYTIAEEKESISLAVNEWTIVKHLEKEKTFKEFFKEKFGDKVQENSDGTVTIKMQYEKEYTVSENGTIESEGEITKIDLDVGAYVEYDVAYTDAYATLLNLGVPYKYSFTKTNGWRLLSYEQGDTEGKVKNVKLVSTGIPTKLTLTGTDDKDTIINKMLNDFENISADTADFRATGVNVSKVYNLSEEDLNEAGITINSTGTKEGLYDLWDLGVYEPGETSNWDYWLSSTYDNEVAYVTGSADGYDTPEGNYEYTTFCNLIGGGDGHGARPVVCLAGEVELTDSNGDGVYEIK